MHGFAVFIWASGPCRYNIFQHWSLALDQFFLSFSVYVNEHVSDTLISENERIYFHHLLFFLTVPEVCAIKSGSWTAPSWEQKMAKGVLIPLSKRVVMCLWKQSIKENNLIKFSWLNRSCAGKDGILHQVMTKWRGNVVGQVRCGVRKPSRELHYQDASCDNFCGWSSQFLHCILGCSAEFRDAQGRKENRGMLTSANTMESSLGRIVRDSSEWGKSWWTKFNTNSC